MLTGAKGQDEAEYRRLLNHEMQGLNIALLSGNITAAELKLQAVKGYMRRMNAREWFDVMPEAVCHG